MDTAKMNQWLTLAANLGVLVGLFLLIYEIRQNTELMRAEIVMDRSTTRVQVLSDWANGGEIVPIEVKLFAEVENFPMTTGWSSLLSAEELRRYHYRMILRMIEFEADWYQCEVGLIDAEICQREVLVRLHRNLHRFYELGINFVRSRESLIAEAKILASELGLPAIDNDGNWVD